MMLCCNQQCLYPTVSMHAPQKNLLTPGGMQTVRFLLEMVDQMSQQQPVTRKGGVNIHLKLNAPDSLLCSG